jgi:hypothetical protein
MRGVDTRIKRRIAIGGAGFAVAAGTAGGAYAAVGAGTGAADRQAFLSDAAARLNVSPARLQSALQGALSDRLDAAVKAGRITQAQADRIEQRMKDGGGLASGAGPRLRPLGGFRHSGGPFRAGLDGAAAYLGLTDAQLRERLRSGETLAQIAGSQGKTADGVKAAIRDAVRARLDTAVRDKRITSDQERLILQRLAARLDHLVDAHVKLPLPPVAP